MEKSMISFPVPLKKYERGTRDRRIREKRNTADNNRVEIELK